MNKYNSILSFFIDDKYIASALQMNTIQSSHEQTIPKTLTQPEYIQAKQANTIQWCYWTNNNSSHKA